MVTTTTGALALPVPENSDPMDLLPETIRDMADQLELTAIPLALNYSADFLFGGSIPNLGAGSDSRSYYYVVGQDLITIVVWVRFGGAGLSIPAGALSIGLPFPAYLPGVSVDPIQFAGLMTLYDSSTGDVYRGIAKVRATDENVCSCLVDGTVAGGPMRSVSGTVPYTIANGDQVAIAMTYTRDIP